MTLLLLGCGWSAEQERVIGALTSFSTAVRESRWGDALEMTTGTTHAVLDSLLDDFSRKGLKGYENPETLFRVLLDEYVGLEGEISTIIIEDDTALVFMDINDSLKVRGIPDLYRMVLERETWNLDLAEVFTDGIRNDLEGSMNMK